VDDLHWTTHILTGACWGYTLGSPPPAAAAGFFGHIALDAMPHNDPDEDWGYVLDSFIGASLLALFFRKRINGQAQRAMFWGAAGAGMPDVELLRNVIRKTEKHERIFPSHDGTIPHRETDFKSSMITEVALFALSLLAALVAGRRRHAMRST
jgi:MYXO-CTERM domain-containing protein